MGRGEGRKRRSAPVLAQPLCVRALTGLADRQRCAAARGRRCVLKPGRAIQPGHHRCARRQIAAVNVSHFLAAATAHVRAGRRHACAAERSGGWTRTHTHTHNAAVQESASRTGVQLNMRGVWVDLQ